MQALTIAMRALHILAGVAWVGSLFFFVFFVEPTSRAIGPAGAPFMGELIGKRKVVKVILWLGTVTILAGAVLYWIDIKEIGFSAFIETSMGLSLTIGAIAALIAFMIGMLGTRPTVEKLSAIGREVAASGSPPSDEQAAAIAGFQKKLRMFARVGLILLVIAVLEMAVARYT